MYHALLQQQISDSLGSIIIPDNYQKLFRAISQSYEQCEVERELLSRYVDMGADQMIGLNNELRKERNDIHNLLDNIDSIFFSFDIINYKIIKLSIASEKITGYTIKELMGDGFWQKITHPDDINAFKSYTEKLLTRRTAIFEHRIIHRNGTIRWVETKIIPIVDKDGNIDRIDGLTTDITEKKIAREKISQTEFLLTEAQKLAKMGNWSANMVSNEIFWSDSLREIKGVNKEYPASFENFIALVHPEDKERVSREIKNIEENGGVLETEYRLIRDNDKQEVILHSIIRAIAKHGKLLQIFGTSKDITQRRTAEDKVKQLNMLMSQISHDLRGPLNSAKNYIYLALKRIEEPTAVNYLTKIEDSYKKLENYILSLLDLQRINRVALIPEEIHMENLILDVISSVDNIPGYDKVKISVDTKDCGCFRSDKQYLRSIIYNLLSNAISYRKNTDDAKIIISAKNDKGNIIITVSDNGIGIPEEIQPRVFDLFVKGDNNSKGTGLGLYIVKSLTEKLGGEISLQSKSTIGTTFTLAIPPTK